MPAYQPSSTPNEQLIITSSDCQPINPPYDCTEGDLPYNSVISRYSLSSGAALSSIYLAQANIATMETIASAGDQYFLSLQLFTVQVNTVTSSLGTLPNVSATLLLMSTDLTTALVPESSGQIGVYRAPFLHASGSGTQPNGSQPATNSNGSQLDVANADGTTMAATIYSIPTHASATVSWKTNQFLSSSNPGLYDARHAWYYIMSGPLNGGAPYRIQIVDTAKKKYLGYINLPGPGFGASVDPTSSDLYVSIGNRIYVYNVGQCGCTVPRRVLTSPFTDAQITVDRNNEHLIVYYTAIITQGGGNTYFEDLNPKTGAVQRSFPTIFSDDTDVVSVSSVLAQ